MRRGEGARLVRAHWLTARLFLGLFILIVAAFFAALAVALVERGKGDARNMAVALQQFTIRTLEVADLVAHDARDFLLRRIGSGEVAADYEAHLRLAELASRLPPGSGIIFVDAAGQVVLSGLDFPAAPVDLSDRDWFAAHLEGRERVIEEALFSRVSLRKMFLITLAVRDAEGRFLGAIDIGVPSNALVGEEALPQFGRQVSLTVLREDGAVLARNEFPDALLGARLVLPPELERGGVAIGRRFVDDRIAVQAASPIPRFGLQAVASIPLWTVLRPLVIGAAAALPLLALVVAGAVLAMRSLAARQRDLEAGKERLESILEASHLGSWHRDLETGTQEVNARWAQMLGYRRDEIEPTVRGWVSLLHPEERDWVIACAEAHIAGETGFFQCEHRMRHKDGHWVWVLDTGRVIGRDASGRGRTFTGTHMDITDRREAEEQMKIVMHEVDHRSKNLLAVVQAIVNLMQAGSVAEFREGLRGRIQALATAHSLLSRNRWRGVALHDLLREELAAWQDQGEGRMRLEGPPVALTAAAAQALAMAIHELATNAAKHGALSAAEGVVDLSWRLTGARDLELVWRERGGPPAAAPSRAGFGSKLLQQTVQGQLGGTAVFDWAEQGLTCVLTVEASRLQALPVEVAPLDPVTAKAPVPGRSRLRRVLLVEDEPIVAMDMQARLRAAGYEVAGPAGSVDAAQALLEEGPVDAAVLDVNLGGEMSFPLAVALRKQGTPVIFVTGYGAGVEVPEELRAVPVLRKPCVPGEIEGALRALEGTQGDGSR